MSESRYHHAQMFLTYESFGRNCVKDTHSMKKICLLLDGKNSKDCVGVKKSALDHPQPQEIRGRRSNSGTFSRLEDFKKPVSDVSYWHFICQGCHTTWNSFNQTLLHSRMWHIQVKVIVNLNFECGAITFRGWLWIPSHSQNSWFWIASCIFKVIFSQQSDILWWSNRWQRVKGAKMTTFKKFISK